ncbi:hypothetical protein [Mesorhizobium sp. NZP2298]|uniref:hypothetical protein n=1 Tax=Mesorhizobium sp. NZP2298 TaxID=2483403 RepID=UPI001552215E|nr:hypothetical protein [Mesorhizobium sp. NZP2298]
MGRIDSQCGVMHRLGKGVAETNKRQPPVRLGRRISAHLRGWKMLDDIARDEPPGRPVNPYRSIWVS